MKTRKTAIAANPARANVLVRGVPGMTGRKTAGAAGVTVGCSDAGAEEEVQATTEGCKARELGAG